MPNIIKAKSGMPIGAIIAYPKTTLSGYLLCHGGTFDATVYPELNSILGGNTLPDLRTRFIRGANNQAEIDGFTKHGDSTKMPNNPFIAADGGVHAHTMNETGDHRHTMFATEAESQAGKLAAGNGNWLAEVPPEWSMRGAGDHHHNIYNSNGHTHTINGGDTETAPKNVILAYLIKAT
jgi:hypothetical protein